MRIVVQRVIQAGVFIAGKQHTGIGKGLLVLVGIAREDTEADMDWTIRKVMNLRVFDDNEGVMNHSLNESGGALLLVSQFTLYGDARKGNRPSYMNAAPPDRALPVYLKMCEKLAALLGSRFSSATFGADMQIHLVNDGPVTLILDSPRD